MTKTSSNPDSSGSASPAGGAVDDARMSFGEHLEELRGRMIKLLVGVVLGTVISLVYSQEVLAIIFRPLMMVLDAQGLPPKLMAVGVSDPFVGFLKIGLICGLIVSMPWILYQLWMFVASGLYAREQRFVKLFGPVSVMLFVAGVAFMYFIVLPIVLSFFVRFNQSFGLPDLSRTGFTRMLLGEADDPAETSAVNVDDLPVFPVASQPPADAPLGATWINPGGRRLCIQTGDGVLSVPLEKLDAVASVSSEFGLKFYISFVLSLSFAFGLAFELPIAVVFLSLTGIVTARQMARTRRYVIFGIFIGGSLLTPPDIISQVLLAVPMVVLFEAGLTAARVIERRRDAAA